MMIAAVLRSRLLSLFSWLVVAALLAFANAADGRVSSQRPELLAYGSRAGMEVTVKSKINIGTESAVISAELTAENAKSYCMQYVLDSSQACQANYLAETKLAKSINANCRTGEFTTFYGDRFQFLRPGRSPDEPTYLVRNLEDGSLLDGSSASGLDYDIDQFRALCPSGLVTAVANGVGNQQRVVGKLVRAAGAGVVPGAIVCKDFQSVSIAFQLYASRWSERAQDRVTAGASQLIRGKPIDFDLSDLGCVLVSAGSEMQLVTKSPVPVVEIEGPDGNTARGVTLPAMISEE